MRNFVAYALTTAAAAALVATSSCGSSNSPPTKPSPPATCAFQATLSTQSFAAEGGPASITIGTTAACAWTVRSDSSWVTVTSGATGTGPGSATLAVAANETTAERSAAVTVVDQQLRVTQQGRPATPCEYTATSSTNRLGAEGGTGTLSIVTAAQCTWTVTSSEPWLTFLSAASGTGPATVTYSAAPWTGTSERAATIRVAGREVVVRQDAPQTRLCEYSVFPTDIGLRWYGQPGLSVSVTTAAGCGWTVAPGADWLVMSGGSSRTGADTVTFSVGTYTGEITRRAALEIRWPTATQGQNVWVTQDGCSYIVIGETIRTFSAAGGRDKVHVFSSAMSPDTMRDCPWTASVNDAGAAWIKLLSPLPKYGEDYLEYEVSPMPADAPVTRTGLIRIENRTVTITQNR